MDLISEDFGHNPFKTTNLLHSEANDNVNIASLSQPVGLFMFCKGCKMFPYFKRQGFVK